MISDVIGKERSINIFAGFTRDLDGVSARLDDNGQTPPVLAPLNSAIQSLPRKPWEDPRDYGAMGESAYEGQAGEDRAQRNLRRFVEAHIVPMSPWKENEQVKSVGGNEVWWSSKDGKKYVSPCTCTGDRYANLPQVQPGNVEVASIASRVANGEVWILKGAMNYA